MNRTAWRPKPTRPMEDADEVGADADEVGVTKWAAPHPGLIPAPHPASFDEEGGTWKAASSDEEGGTWKDEEGGTWWKEGRRGWHLEGTPGRHPWKPPVASPTCSRLIEDFDNSEEGATAPKLNDSASRPVRRAFGAGAWYSPPSVRAGSNVIPKAHPENRTDRQ